MITQPEFEEILSQLPPEAGRPAVLPKPRRGINKTNFTIGLYRALRVEYLDPRTFGTMVAVARDQAGARGHSTIPALVQYLGITFQAVSQQINGNPLLFSLTKNPGRPAAVLHQIRLTQEGVDMLVRINRRTARYAKELS